ncbi:aarF domain-containing kinase [Entomortierella parvispora]|uniref:AarF domain-containing kinase n=1 Tax=Entomortierella parvispora TaxID=205924 RepID=A0A9P3HA40_9FUNG|nr:aarF domain-containing kinase [Entomortierella parvispora]
MLMLRSTSSSIAHACGGSLRRTTALPRQFPLRFQSTSSSSKPSLASSYANWSPSIALPRRIPLKVAVPVLSLATGVFLYNVSDSFRHTTLALQRVMLAAEAVVVVGVDYKYTLDWANRDLKEGDLIDDQVRLERKSQLHKRSADRMREMLRKNGGIYIKLGQHLASLKYLLPDEWTTAMEPLQDRCTPSTIESIQALFLSDIGQPVSAFFSSFDLEPIGVASLAQVHRATLLDGREVAVKIQHPALQEFSTIDIKTVAALTSFVAYVFPEFEFSWLSEEMQVSLPKELNFNFEAANSARVNANFNQARAEGSKSTIKVPDVIWSKNRVLVMEFMVGARIDDLEYLKEHDIKVSEVSKEMARTFSQMIYKDGFVHCDPHPGNLMIRPTPTGSSSPRNFEIILLDHGLYRELTPEFRLDYAHLWTAIIASDEKEIKYRALKLGGTDAYQLFSCILTGRDWSVVQDNQLTKKVRTKDEMVKIADGAGNRIAEIADILAKVPRDLLLLFKTNDLLRALDEDLGADDGSQMRTFAVMGQYCAQAIYEADRAVIRSNVVASKITVSLLTKTVKTWFKTYWTYMRTTLSLDLFILWIDMEQTQSLLYLVLARIGKLIC